MKNFIEYININNFKSINDLTLEDCRRVNLFLGYPNVGKSNVLEALSLFCVPFLKQNESLNRFVRAENPNELFYNAGNKVCSVETNVESVKLNAKNGLILHREISGNKISYLFLDLNFMGTGPKIMTGSFISDSEILTGVKKYIFRPKNKWESTGKELLLPPFGENIIDVLSYSENASDLKIWIKQELAKYGLEYILDKSSNSLKVQRRLGSDEVFQLPYSSIADTLQRVIFYKTAIASNKNSVLLFEEPEAHAFPPYIKTITQDIIDSTSNQFFIVTHSPIILNNFIEYADLRKEVSIYLFDFKDGRTTAKRLSDEEVDEVYNYGEDLFFNIENFLS